MHSAQWECVRAGGLVPRLFQSTFRRAQPAESLRHGRTFWGYARMAIVKLRRVFAVGSNYPAGKVCQGGRVEGRGLSGEASGGRGSGNSHLAPGQ